MKTRLQRPLPGRAAHRVFAPELSYGRQAGPAPDASPRAAVLMLLYPDAGGWSLPFTLRPPTMSSHAGQISFPGGLIEYGESSCAAALRELEEELGVVDVEVLGRLSEFYVFVSGFKVTPWLGVLRDRPKWRPNPAEVAEVIEVPLTHLVDPASASELLVDRFGCLYRAPAFAWGQFMIWGATSMMLNELVVLAREIGWK
jgi:8-oxo-dGTP pyrophosphatase MutT (NUDIX family)